ncbi:DGQHR domain-containing protein DpdB [Sphingomonas kyeonggiensis]|uniref:DGQHR domain-containing protein n=1 Tax=Sphingomonas kyeonggiensis TaxID=1268553 RepID=A0A7W6JXW1_9SPHN|nr:DGQHR domain-containing protein DpdB [Sphingomonas kyeonggiensis]MBB4100487.1 DGQHR domain-containing protein [Sphingomonas kyeonggiensis]
MNQAVFSPTISPRQAAGPRVVCFTATASRILDVARIERIGRNEEGRLSGFQRPQIASHIREIRDYLATPEAMLPNSIVIAFSSEHARYVDGTLQVTVKDGAPGWVVDGQQRLCAAAGLDDKCFEMPVAAFICEDMLELNRQFILINNTRPLSKPLIYELLPGVTGLPHRLSDRAGAALLIEALNYDPTSSLHGMIHQQTNPDGIIKDTLMQKLLMNSLRDGALRSLDGEQLLLDGKAIVSDFFAALRSVFASDWDGHTSKTSRLLHGTGLIAMGFAMDEIAGRYGETDRRGFERWLQHLRGHMHWSSGDWEFGAERRPWNSLQNTNADYRMLSHHVVRLLRRAGRAAPAAA